MLENLKNVLTIENIIYLVAILIIAVVIMFVLKTIRNKAEEELASLLYVKNDTAGYLALLENKRLNLVFRKSTILIYKLDGHLVCGNKDAINYLFDKILSLKLEPKERIEFNMKKLSYYACEGDKIQSESALASIEKILGKEERYAYIVNEARLIFDIYINKNTDNIQKLKAMVKKEKNATKRGITLYRIAKLEYFKGNLARAEESLLEAKKYLKGTHWYDICNEAIKNKDVLGYK